MLTKVKPAVDGQVVRVPGSEKPLDAKGQNVPMNSYWRRRLRDGSVIVVDPSPKSGKAKSEKKD